MTKEQLRQISPEEMVLKGLLTPAPNGGYICDDCGNGRGENGTGVAWNYVNGGWLGKCFKCGKGYDIFKLIELKFNLHTFAEQFAKANEIFDPKPISKPKKDYEKFITVCNRNLKSFVNKSYRGITFETYNKFLCGYDFTTKRFIIPTSYNHFLERYTGNGSVKSPKKHTGPKEIFAMKFAKDYPTIFIVEGEFDALSLWDINKPAISFSGSDFSKHQQDLFKIFDKNKFIIMFDNDDTGKLKAAKVSQLIKSMGYSVATEFLPAEYNDANDFIVADRKKFIETIDQIILSAQFEEQPEELFGVLRIPDDFRMDETGIHITKSKDIQFSTVPVRIDRIYRSTDYKGYKVELAIFNPMTKSYLPYIISRADIADHKKLMLLLADFGVNVNLDNAKIWSVFLGDLINVNMNNIPQTIVVKRPGWIGDTFAYPGETGKYLIDNGTPYEKEFCMKGDKQTWLNLLKENFHDMPVFVTLGTVLAAPMISICKERHIQLALIAPSMRGKSAVIGLAMSVYGDPDELKKTFNGTGNGINDLGWRYNDLPCWIDEFQAASKQIKDNIDQLIYAYEIGKSRLRLNKLGEQREVYEFTGSRIFTAEQSLLKASSGQGAYTRLLELSFPNFTTREQGYKIHQTLKEHYGFFGKAWINYITKNRDNILATHKMFYNKLLEDYPDHAHSYIQSVSLIMNAVYHFNKECLHFYDETDIMDLIELKAGEAFEVLPTAAKSTNAHRALKDLAESLISRSKEFMRYNKASEHDSHLDKFLESAIQPSLGVVFKDGDVGFFPSVVKEFLEKDCGYPECTAIFRALKEMGALEIGNAKAEPLKAKKRVNDKSQFFYVVRKDYLESV